MENRSQTINFTNALGLLGRRRLLVPSFSNEEIIVIAAQTCDK
jgi:hypothetical protein